MPKHLTIIGAGLGSPSVAEHLFSSRKQNFEANLMFYGTGRNSPVCETPNIQCHQKLFVIKELMEDLEGFLSNVDCFVLTSGFIG